MVSFLTRRYCLIMFCYPICFVPVVSAVWWLARSEHFDRKKTKRNQSKSLKIYLSFSCWFYEIAIANWHFPKLLATIDTFHSMGFSCLWFNLLRRLEPMLCTRGTMATKMKNYILLFPQSLLLALFLSCYAHQVFNELY